MAMLPVAASTMRLSCKSVIGGMVVLSGKGI
jgi:hypothetical protein